MIKHDHPPAEELREWFHYEPATGSITWRKRVSRAVKAGAIAGYIVGGKGYRYIKYRGRLYMAARLAWLLQTGEWPDGEIDHRDTYGPKADWGDRWENLRLTTRQQNAINRRVSKNNTSGYSGVRWHAADGRWRATIGVSRKTICLGGYAKFEDAVAARVAAERKYFGAFAPTAEQRPVRNDWDRSK